nr:Retrovirus-related Pol polyprotein from transposon TNT 1-94 [Ipomoea batatas]
MKLLPYQKKTPPNKFCKRVMYERFSLDISTCHLASLPALLQDIDKVKKPESRDSGSLVDIEPVSRRDTDDVYEIQENGQNGDPVPDYQGDTVNADGHVDDVVHQEQEVPSQVQVDPPRRSDRERRPSTRYSPSQYVLLTDGGEPESYEEAMENMMTKALPRGKFEVCCSIAGMAISST